MTAFEIKNIKSFMNTLLIGNCFDIFLVEEAEVTTYNVFHIDGRINKSFYTEKDDCPPYEFSKWEEIRPIILSLIKGKQTPTAFKFTLHLMPEYLEGLLRGKDTTITENQIRALAINIKYENGRLLLVTGTSLNTFIMDKSLDVIWDESMKRFLVKHELDFETA